MRYFIVTSILVPRLISAFADFSYGVSVLPTLAEYEFRDWIKTEQKVYNSKEEYKYRFEIFKKNE